MMTSQLDRAIIFLISILMLIQNQVDNKTVCLILGVIIIECLNMYFNNSMVIKLMTVVYILLALWQPEFVAFFPLLIYNFAYIQRYTLIPVFMLISIVVNVERLGHSLISKDVGFSIVVMLVGISMGMRAERESIAKEKLHHLQDEESYLKQKTKQHHEEIVRKQDNEIHAATLAERNRIAREIHDHVGHMLSRSILQLGAILAINKDENLKEPLKGLKDSLDTAMNNIRESVHDLKDDSLDLEYMVKDIINQYENLNVSLDYDMGQYLSKELKYCFVAIVKEALTNTVKHSDATRVTIVMREHPALYQVLIEDNGSGNNKATKGYGSAGNISGKVGIGLENMKERISAFGGNIRFTEDNGFKIFITIPKDRDGRS